jgi:amino acid transporter
MGSWRAYALLGASSLAELGAAIPRSGGHYNFARRGIGEFAGFLVGWSDWLSTCGTNAIMAIVIAEYSVALLPSLSGGEKPLAVSILLFFALLQWRGVKWGSGAQLVTAALKTGALILLVTACFLREPSMPRPYRAWGYPWTIGIALLASVVFLIVSLKEDRSNAPIAFGILLISYPLFWILKRVTSRTALSAPPT